MASKENQQARRYWEELSAALTPGDGAELTIDELRAAFDKWAEQLIALSPEARLEHVVADGVPCIWARMPGTSTARTIVYYHGGGGYLLGSATAYAGFGAALSAAADAQVLVVDYRLAPENPHPAALEDSATAYRWALRQGADAGSTVVAGDSAGGGLALAVIDSLRAAGESLPAAAVCLSPWVDMTFAGESYLTNAGVLTTASRLIAARVGGFRPWQLVYQSRSGPPSQPWLGPDVCEHIADLAAAGAPAAVLVPVGFISDHMEVKHDLDVEAAQAAVRLGLPLERAATPGTDPRFVTMVTDLVRKRTGSGCCPANCCTQPA
jgi:acetyl esterase/lipase